jgi:hypothetical protein
MGGVRDMWNILTINIKIENIWSRTKTFPLKVGHSTTRVLLSIC